MEQLKIEDGQTINWISSDIGILITMAILFTGLYYLIIQIVKNYRF